MPRTPRFLAPWAGEPNAEPAIYHCISRVVGRDRVFHAAEKTEFVRLMRLYERFCGLRILTHCVMSNHFHLLVEVPSPPERELSDEELCQRLAVLYSEAEVEEVRKSLRRFREKRDEKSWNELRGKYLYRMWNLSEFMKSLKQRFSKWFNKRHNRRGTLWEERFKNPLVEAGCAARRVAAYIDLNAVRAGIVDRPEQYQWCGYSEAVIGHARARAGMERLMEDREGFTKGSAPSRSWRRIIGAYRVILYTGGEERLREDPVTGEVKVARRGISREEAQRIIESGGILSAGEMLLCRVRAFSDGLAIGTERFVEKVFRAKRDYFGPKRRSGSRPIHGCDTTLRCARSLRKAALG